MGADGMKGRLVLAGIAALVSTAALADGGPRLQVPGIEIVPHPAPRATDYSTCLIKCADRQDACVRHARGPRDLRECRLQRSLCDSDCNRYGIGER
jgi:hypothetical protein